MNCPQCEELVDEGAAYCGNCGLDVRQLNGTAAAEEAATAGMPAYAVAKPEHARAEAKAMAGLILGVLAVPAAVIPILGLLLAIISLVLATVSRSMLPKKTLGNLTIVFASVAVVLSVASYAYNASQYDRQAATFNEAPLVQEVPLPTAVGNDDDNKADTACYSAALPHLSQVETAAGSCSIRAFEGEAYYDSTRSLAIDAARQSNVTAANFFVSAKEFAASHLAFTLPGYTATAERQGTFAGSPAYFLDARKDKSAVLQVAVILHQSVHGENTFVLVHSGGITDEGLKTVETGWKWK